jgi:SAM-dependent methyltransferase
MSDENSAAWRQANRLSWNAATRAHNAHKVDQAGFLRRGGSTLFGEELELLGGVAGRRIAHLQCNAGQDTLSLAALGAEVVGVDIADEAIEFARALSRDSGIAAAFACADVYAWLAEAAGRGERFDVVFSSYGFLYWLDDLEAWARGVEGVLRPGGRFVCVEFHPMLNLMNDADGNKLGYFAPHRHTRWEEGIGDYVGEAEGMLSPSGHVETAPFENPHACVEFEWRIDDVLNALAGARLVLEAFREYPFSNGCLVRPILVAAEGRRYVMPEGEPSVAMMFGVRACRET